MSEPTCHKLKSHYSGMSVPLLSQMCELQDENSRLKRLYADFVRVHNSLKDVVGVVCSENQIARQMRAAGIQSGLRIHRHDLPPACRTKVMAVSPQILENCGYEDHTIYR